MTDPLIAIVSARLGEPISTFDFRDFRAVTMDGQPLDLVVGETHIAR